MRILIISYHFPPYNTIAAVRMGKMAKYLRQFGHDVRVVAGRSPDVMPSLALEIPPEHVIYAGRPDPRLPAVEHDGLPMPASTPRPGLFHLRAVSLGNKSVGWAPFALAAVESLLPTWRPDIVYATFMPYNAFLVADRLAKKYHLPWVAEFRDLWVDNHYYQAVRYRRKPWKRWYHAWLERRLLATPCGLVTVSAAWADTLRAKYALPIAVVRNGYDPVDFPDMPGGNTDAGLRLVYIGTIHDGRQDPTPLFQALAQLAPAERQVRVIFYDSNRKVVMDAAHAAGVADCVEVRERISYRESLVAQRQADALLFLLWNDPAQRGFYSGKIFEYLGARRPVLAVGLGGDVAEELITSQQAGVICHDAAAVAAQLRAWLAHKHAARSLPDLPAAATAGLTREEQAHTLEQFLLSLIGKSA